ncbi:RagB/SusD family nutrient uptake outer membrane protein [Sinomicrobium sp. M5D2P17]
MKKADIDIFNQSTEKNSFYKVSILFLTITTSLMISCKDFVEIDPPDSELVQETVFKNDETAIAAITAIYHQMQLGGFASGSNSSITVLGEISADILTEYSTNNTRIEFYQNTLMAINNINQGVWSSCYNTIYMANAVLEGIANSPDISVEIIRQLEGEAKFIRAFCYFYLVNFYGEIPLLTTTDYRLNAVAPRDPAADVYQQILVDLEDAIELLKEDYTISDGERIRPNKGAATAVLSRVYLYMENWENAEANAATVINNSLYNLKDIDQVFLANSEEAIWQLLPVQPDRNTWEGFFFILESDPTAPFTQSSMAFTNELINAFETGDQRKDKWVESFDSGNEIYYYPFKYKIKADTALTEYSMVLRLAEQYLIRAEARTHQGNITGAQEDINIIRNRAGLGNTTATTQSELLDVILQERQVELFTEWGNRWLDLKRMERINMVLGNIKPNWQPTSALFPIPEQEILNNPNLTQNAGY